MPLFLSDNRPSYRTVLDHRRQSVRPGRITSVRDTCEDCNGGVLSQLDNYASTLDRKHFLHIVGSAQNIEFKYDFKKLLRWLLKLSYNDDRTGPPPFETMMFVPYILGKEPNPPLQSNLLLGLIAPSRTSTEQQKRGIPAILEPESCGVGYLYINEPAKADIALSRIVQINSYLFCVIAWKPQVQRPTRRRHITGICRAGSYCELRPGESAITITRPSMDFLTFQTKYMVRGWQPFRSASASDH
jgi:hypothetical protein